MSRPDSGSAMLRFSLITRCAMLLVATSTAMLGILAPSSMSAQIWDQDGAAELAVQITLLCLAIVGWLDVVINDLLPDRYRMQWARKRRHLGFALLGALYLVKAFASAGTHIQGGWVLIAFYVAFAGICAWYTWAAALRPGHAL